MTRQLPQGAPRSARLPHSRGPFAPEIVDEIQRRRIVDSLVAVAAECGYGAVTIERILRHAHMAAQTFYALFDGKEDCLLTAFRVLADQLGGELGDAWGAEESWPSKVRAAIAVALAFAAEEPVVARLLAVEVQAGGREAHAAQAESIERLAAKLREGRRLYPEAAGLNPATEDVIAAGVVSLIGNHLLDGEEAQLPGLADEIAALALAPFLACTPLRKRTGS